MQTSAANFPEPKNPALLVAVLTAAGLAGNYLKFTFFLDLEFLFGSIFAMLALQFLGLRKGIAVGWIIAASTCLLWHHPYGMAVMASEVAFVGFLVLRRGVGMVLADTCFWILLGIPLTYLLYHLAMQLPTGETTITMAKLTVNGIANTLLARLIFMGYALRFRTVKLSYREIVHNLFSFFVLFPSLIIMALSSRTDFREMDRAIRTSLTQDSQRIDKLMDTWVVNRRQTTVVLAETVASKDPREVAPFLKMAALSDPNFKQMALMDKNAEVVAFYPPPGEGGGGDLGLNLADRHYVPRLKESLKPMLSEVSFVWSGTPRPRVAMLAPVLKKGTFDGYVCGVLSLNQTKALLDKFTEHTEKLYTLSDRHGRVIMSNRSIPGLDDPDATVREGVMGWLRHQPVVAPPAPGANRYVAEIVIGDMAEWRLTLEQPVAPFQKSLYRTYTGKLTLLLLVLVVSLGLAELLSRWIMVNLLRLLEVTRALPARLASGATVEWPETSVSESNYLIGNFREMADSLNDRFREIRSVNESLARQTALLTESEAKYRLLFDSANDAILLTDTGGRILEANPQAVEHLGYPHAELVVKTMAEIESPQEAPRVDERLARLMEQGALTFETMHQRKDGTLIPTEVSARLVEWDHRPVVLGICRDITERKRAYQSRLIAMRDLIGAIAHQWRQPLSTLGMIIQRTHALGTMQGLTPEYLSEFKANAMRQVRYMSDTIEEFRNFYRPDKEKESFSPVSCIEDAVRLLDAQFAHHAISVRIEDHGIQPLIAGVPNEFKQVVLNLLGNARDAIVESRRNRGTPEQGLIEIKVADAGEMITIEVSDNGCGIPDDVAAKLFTPHFTTKKERGGTGIGLYMSKMIVEESMGGTLSLRQAGTPAVFRIELPVEKA